MFEQGRETLPVAISDLERRKQNNQEILQAIEHSMANEAGMTADSKQELEGEKNITVRYIGWLATQITSQQQIYI